jgi:hypothetical protein
MPHGSVSHSHALHALLLTSVSLATRTPTTYQGAIADAFAAEESANLNDATCFLQTDSNVNVFPAPAPPAGSLLKTAGPTPSPSPATAIATLPWGSSANSLSEVCVSAKELPTTISNTIAEVVKGLPQWSYTDTPATKPDVRLAFLTQVSYEEQLILVKRMFHNIYSAKDTFLYLVDEYRMHPSKVRSILPEDLPGNVIVQAAPHAGYFYWPRVQVVLDGLKDLLKEPWDFVVHLSESDYPLHRMDWIRSSLAMQRQRSFINLTPKCFNSSQGQGVDFDEWYWWTQKNAVASCGAASEAGPVEGMVFPTEHLEERGFKFARAPEWVVLTRELVQYAVSPELKDFRRLIGMHSAADEIFWSTLVLNIPNFTQSLGQQSWFEIWPVGSTGHSPETLTAMRRQEIVTSRPKYFFMRKVHRVDSIELLAQIDAVLAEPEPPPTILEARKLLAVSCTQGGDEGDTEMVQAEVHNKLLDYVGSFATSAERKVGQVWDTLHSSEGGGALQGPPHPAEGGGALQGQAALATGVRVQGHGPGHGNRRVTAEHLKILDLSKGRHPAHGHMHWYN